MKKVVILLLVLCFIIPVFAQSSDINDSTFQHHIFRIDLCQLTRYGAKVNYFDTYGYMRTIYVPMRYVNKVFFVKVDTKTTYSFMHLIMKEDEVMNITVYLPNIMVTEYSTMDFSEEDIEAISEVDELSFLYF